MCGIFCVLNNFCNNCDNLISQLKFEQNIKNRGPDNFDFKVFSTDDCTLAFASSVLWLQGKTLTAQPIEDADSIFIYNGDIFSSFNETLQKDVGDTKLFYAFLKEHIANNSLHDLDKVHGPYAFIFFDKHNKKLYFGRDIFGRRSLLLGKNKESDTLILTSVAKRRTEFDFIEIPAVGTFCYNILSNKFEVYCWQHKNKNYFSKLKEFEAFLLTDIGNVFQKEDETDSGQIRTFIENENLCILRGLKENGLNEEGSLVFNQLLNSNTWMKNVKLLQRLLENSIAKRISTQPQYCKQCIQNKANCKHATVGILFSGGVDCAILALLCDKYVDKKRPIDLINVSFDEAKDYQSPDRISGLQTLEELQLCCPERKWNFIEVNVTKDVLDKERDAHIADLIYPLNTILDDSLGCALWFAARGQCKTYTTPCRVLIVGMGADELFGGYIRHRFALKRYSWQGLQNLLDEDWQNLPYRNLGRDDRVVSDHGRQLRTPYLDENVVQFLRSLECWEKTYPSSDLPLGVGEKVLLRSLAFYLGLKNAAILKKKALQFGSKIANPKENGHEISSRLCN
ncbi:asparagine synthetase domain-containing protein CG17486 [Sitophilus oryzae]|uniref:Asparagine synthetase domain-containing protein CG17486 n=1 Tax=Sitophilus oryzae TaxID=7048 RepID=A0A6J2X4J9_SITOR|nr:asparagine synthetase domain-containing protein CG17486 [Sitophilus oryzae]